MDGGYRLPAHKRTATDCPRISQAFLDKERKRLGPLMSMYSQEYECQWVDAETSVFSRALVEAALVDSFDPPFPNITL